VVPRRPIRRWIAVGLLAGAALITAIVVLVGHTHQYRVIWLATTACPSNKKWPFSVEIFYSTGGSGKFQDSVACH
jgi:hypothetical protein